MNLRNNLDLSIDIYQRTENQLVALAVATHESIDRVAGNANQRVGSLCGFQKFFHVLYRQVGDQITELIDVNRTLPRQGVSSKEEFLASRWAR